MIQLLSHGKSAINETWSGTALTLQETDSRCFMFYHRYVFWIDCCEHPHIGRVGMDGSGARVIIRTDTHTPSALTIDYVNSRIYWADGNRILFSDTDGSRIHRGTKR